MEILNGLERDSKLLTDFYYHGVNLVLSKADRAEKLCVLIIGLKSYELFQSVYDILISRSFRETFIRSSTGKRGR